MTKALTTKSYVAFLRGINNIGRKTVKMLELKRIFEANGFQNVITIQASGNIVFETTISEASALVKDVENLLESKLGYNVKVTLRTLDELTLLIKSKPFGHIKITPRTKLLLTFLAEKPMSEFKIPFKLPNKNFTIIRITDNEIYSVVNLSPDKPSYRIMNFLEKEFGNKITTRNWNTIVKIVNKSDYSTIN
jgi:uncharacterized protein (DUF1697 family)